MIRVDVGERAPSERMVAGAAAAWRTLNGVPAAHAKELGWLRCDAAAEDFARVEAVARQVRDAADTLVVVGVGGSNQASRAVIDALGARGVSVLWAGNTLSAWELRRLLDSLAGRSVALNVIAKNFETLEPGSHYRVLREWMRGADAARRVVLTGTRGSRLEAIARENGHAFLPFPERVGGRFSAFTPVALLPLAAAGIDIAAYLAGGRDMEASLRADAAHPAFQYAAWRRANLRRGFSVEMLCAFEPRLERFARWWRQLFGESEGKDGGGIFPATAMYSEDLHAIGQYVQEGARQLMETFLAVDDAGASVVVPEDAAFRDGFDYLAGMDFAAINRAAEDATVRAHRDGGVPCCVLRAESLDAYRFGALFYFFMAACAAGGYSQGVNPFDQEGVEAYKRRMFAALGKL